MNIEKTMENLRKNNMLPFFVKDKKEAYEKVRELINEGDTVSVGGSVTLMEAGIVDLLKSGKYNFLDRYKEGLTRDALEEIYRQTFFADCFLSSTNAITENGELYNVDGNCNRVAALLFGPKSVIIVAGKNKIVKDLSEAAERVKTIAAPKNAVRLSLETYCSKEGGCIYKGEGADGIGHGCSSDVRICAGYVVCARQRIKDRIKVIIIDESLGY